jgi:hypothetical protein
MFCLWDSYLKDNLFLIEDTGKQRKEGGADG